MLNFRDAGGHPTESGGMVRTGVLWRGDAPFDLDEPTARALASLRLRTVVDLRSPDERELRPYDLPAIAQRSAAVPLVDKVLRDAGPRDGFSHFNVWAVKHRGGAVGQAVSALAGPGALPALVHCTAGKDRTGIVIAVVQALLGVPDDTIAEDYSLSAERLRVNTEEAFEKQRLALGVDVRERPELLEARPEWILGALEWIRANHGTPREYLIAHDVAPGDLDRLSAALVQNGSVQAA